MFDVASEVGADAVDPIADVGQVGLTVGAEAKGGLALAAVSVDGMVSPEFLETLSEDEDILDARAVYFDG